MLLFLLFDLLNDFPDLPLCTLFKQNHRQGEGERRPRSETVPVRVCFRSVGFTVGLLTTSSCLWGLREGVFFFFTYLAGKKMPADFDDDLVFLIRSLVPRYDDLSAGEALQLVHLGTKSEASNYSSAPRLQRIELG